MRQARTTGVAPAVVRLREDDECPTGSGLVRPGACCCSAGGQDIVDTVECHLVRQRLRRAYGDLGVVGVHRDLLELVPCHGTGRLRRLRASHQVQQPRYGPASRSASSKCCVDAANQASRPHGRQAQPGRTPAQAWPGERRQAPRRRWRPSGGAPRPGDAPDRTGSTRGRSAPARRGWARRRPRPGRPSIGRP